MSWDSKIDSASPAVKKEEEENPCLTDDEVKKILTKNLEEESRFCCMMYGSDGTAKSGLTLSYISQIEPDEKIVIIDLDGGNLPLIKSYYKDKIGQFMYENPLRTKEGKNGMEIDYIKTYAVIRDIVRYVKNNYKKDKIKAIVFDGLSTALTYAENQMRIEKNINPDGGVNMQYWKLRNKRFLETLEQIKSIPIARFFIAHEDFIANKDELSSVKSKTNQMMFQKIRCQRIETPEEIVFKATIDKSKYNVNVEGKTFELCVVNKTTGVAKWKADEMWKQI